MTNKYREYCIDPIDFRTFLALQEIVNPIFDICASAEGAAKGSYEQYSDWVKMWKDYYNILSLTAKEIQNQHDFSQSDKHAAKNYLRRLANTMLNARQFARDVRHHRKTKKVLH